MLRVTASVAIPLDEVVVRASRSSGPGGQHANVTASRIEASFDVAASRTLTGEQKRRLVERCGPRVVAVAQDARSQARNRELALERLSRRIAHGLHVPRPRRAPPPLQSPRPARAPRRRAGGRRRRLEAKRRASEKKATRRRVDPD